MPHQGAGTRPIMISAQERVSYQIDVDGDISRVLAEDTNSPNNFAEEDDAIIATDTGYRVEGQTGSTTPGNTTWWGDVFHTSGPITGIHLTSEPAPPVRFYLDGQEMTRAEIAAQWKPAGWNVLEIVASNLSNYDFTANGTVRRYQTGPNTAAESKTDSVQQGANTSTVSGATGGGAGDAYVVEGDVTQFSADGSVTLRWNGTQVTADELTGVPSEPDPDPDPDEPDTPDDPDQPVNGDDEFNWQAAGVLVGSAALGLALTRRKERGE